MQRTVHSPFSNASVEVKSDIAVLSEFVCVSTTLAKLCSDCRLCKAVVRANKEATPVMPITSRNWRRFTCLIPGVCVEKAGFLWIDVERDMAFLPVNEIQRQCRPTFNTTNNKVAIDAVICTVIQVLALLKLRFSQVEMINPVPVMAINPAKIVEFTTK